MKLKTLLSIGAVALTIGCTPSVKTNYEGFNAELSHDYFNGFNNIRLSNPKKENEVIIYSDINRDGRIDEIGFRNVPNGSPLEKFASLEEGQKIYKTLMENKK